MNKKIIVISIVAVSLVLAFIVADYLTLFGVKSKQELDFAVVEFEPVDAKTGAPIYDAHATCYRHRNHDACTERESKRGDTVTVHFPMYVRTKHSLLFNKGTELDVPLEGEINIMIIHNNYYKYKDTFLLKDIYQGTLGTIRIKMKAHDMGESEAGEQTDE